MCRVRETAGASQGAKGQEKSRVMSKASSSSPSRRDRTAAWRREKERQVLPRESLGEKNPGTSKHCTLISGRKTELCVFQAKEEESELLVTVRDKELEAHDLSL